MMLLSTPPTNSPNYISNNHYCVSCAIHSKCEEPQQGTRKSGPLPQRFPRARLRDM
ncbi:UNVERIFIED_CONTAM: hypothetical protein GTU68_029670 [Idotea baltica]|nr:hypothetical protein [Idotea baltica]